MPVCITRPSLVEVADAVEQIYTIAFTENLYPSTEDRRAASLEYAAEHRLSRTRLEAVMRSSLQAMREVEEIARRLRLLQLYGQRWRPWTPDRKALPVPPRPHGVLAAAEPPGAGHLEGSGQGWSDRQGRLREIARSASGRAELILACHMM